MSGLQKARRSLTARLWVLQMAVFIGVGIAMAAVYHHTELAHIDDDLLRQARWLRDSFPPPFDDEHLTKELAEIAVSAQWPIGAMVHKSEGRPALRHGILSRNDEPSPSWNSKPSGKAFVIATPHGRRLRAVWTPLAFGDYERALFVAPLTAVEGAFRELLLIMAGAGAALATVTAAASWWFSGAALRPVEESQGRMGQFLADSSHELRSPLSAIIGEVDVALRRPRSVEEYRSSLEACGRTARDMMNVVSRVLEISRIEAEAPIPSHSLVDVSQLAEALGDESSRQLASPETGQPELVIDAEPGAIVYGNEDLLVAVLTNLVQNAFLHGRGATRIQVTVRRDGGTVRLSVSDDGEGIEDEDRPKVFERFYRGRAGRSAATHHGAGLGLAIVAETARRHGGRVTVDSRPGDGTTFTVELPAADSRASS